MLTSLRIRNFKQFDEIQVELGNPVVLVGPNNSGKTTTLQALALWDIGLRRWNERRTGKSTPGKRPGVTINRKDLIALPIPDASLLWRDLHVRNVQRAKGVQETKNIRIDIIVEGVTNDVAWQCGLEFDYANDEVFYCRPLRTAESKDSPRMEIPSEAAATRIAFLPSMSGLAAHELRLDQGAVNVRLGEGRTAEVLRNLCHQLASSEELAPRWQAVCERVRKLFGVTLEKPVYVAERGEITMSYRTSTDVRLDLSASGRGLQQVVLLLTYLELNHSSVLLLDEPDAHQEILRQRQIYEILAETARKNHCQVVIASHSEVILNEAAERDVVVAFVGRPHRIDKRGCQHVLKSLKEFGWDQYFLAEQTGWVLYLEGSTDLAILQAFAKRLGHRVQSVLERPFVAHVGNQPNKARGHFWGLREAVPDLVGYLLCDRLESRLSGVGPLREYMWERREIENYFCQPETLASYAFQSGASGDRKLFGEQHRKAMDASVKDNMPPAALRDPDDSWWRDVKASDDFLVKVFRAYHKQLNLPVSLLDKNDFHVLADYVDPEQISPEVVQVLDAIYEVSQQARPRT